MGKSGYAILSFISVIAFADARAETGYHDLIFAMPVHVKESAGTFASLQSDDNQTVVVNETHLVLESEARKLMRDKSAALGRLLKPASDPYFGTRDPGPTCDPSRLPSPKTSEGKSVIFQSLAAYATESHVYGACNAHVDVLKSQLLWIYCRRQHTLYEVKTFYSAENSWMTRPVAQCKSI